MNTSTVPTYASAREIQAVILTELANKIIFPLFRLDDEFLYFIVCVGCSQKC